MKSYHELAMRTAGPEVFHEPYSKEGKDQFTREFTQDLAVFLMAASKLDMYKSLMFYGKSKPERNMHDIAAALTMRSGAAFNPNGFDFRNVGNPQAIHAILGIATEGAELVEDLMLLMSNVDRPERQAVIDNLSRETGDIDWYQELLALSTGVPVEQSRVENIDRLQKRFPGKFSEEDALARADEKPVPRTLDELFEDVEAALAMPADETHGDMS